MFYIFRRNAGTAQVIVSVGGEDDKVVLRSVEYWDPCTNVWKQLAALPFAVRYVKEEKSRKQILKQPKYKVRNKLPNLSCTLLLLIQIRFWYII